jgi:hypothetical protein
MTGCGLLAKATASLGSSIPANSAGTGDTSGWGRIVTWGNPFVSCASSIGVAMRAARSAGGPNSS